MRPPTPPWMRPETRPTKRRYMTPSTRRSYPPTSPTTPTPSNGIATLVPDDRRGRLRLGGRRRRRGHAAGLDRRRARQLDRLAVAGGLERRQLGGHLGDQVGLLAV